MNIAITGETGFLGYHLVKYYKQKGYNIISLGRNYLNSIKLLKNCDLLIHAAGVNRSNNPSDVFDGNLNLSTDLVNSLENFNIQIPIKFISSIQEGNNTAYGQSKRLAKNILKEYCDRNNTKFQSYKLPNLFGVNGKPYYNSVVNTFAYNFVIGKQSQYNENSISLCWVEDAINVIDDQTDEYVLYETTVKEIHDIINGNSILPPLLLKNKLDQIVKYYKNMAKKILVLGHKGMLGSMVCKYLEGNGFQISKINSRFPSKSFDKEISQLNIDYIINCIGAIPQKTKDFNINFDLPVYLNNFKDVKVIHPGTDCEMDDEPYGLSKKKGSDYIKENSTNTKIIKTSIIGPEESSGFGLMAWFSNQEGEVNGYTKAMWNGNTTLEWAKWCEILINNWDEFEIETILEGEPISKYEMLKLFKDFYNKKITIIPVELGKDKTLKGQIKTKPLKNQLEELKFII